jgi:hypothetical protein
MSILFYHISDRNLGSSTKRSNRYSSSEYEIPDDIFPDEYEIREEYDVDIPEYSLSTFKDYKLLSLKKKYSRPYFFPYLPMLIKYLEIIMQMIEVIPLIIFSLSILI